MIDLVQEQESRREEPTMAHAELGQHDKITIISSYNDRHLIGQVPGSRYADGGWTVPLSWTSCVALRGLFGAGLTLGPALTGWAFDLRRRRLDPATAMRDVLSLTASGPFDVREIRLVLAALDQIEYDATLRLYAYQVVDLVFLVLNRRALLANEPGLG